MQNWTIDSVRYMSANLSLPFYNNAKKHPERLALSVNQRDFTYGDLADVTERIAGWLQEQSVGDVKLVGILASRSWVAYAGLLGACWAGAAYVPLNPDWPEQRLMRILETIELDALVVDDRGLKLLSAQVLNQSPESHPGSRHEHVIFARNIAEYGTYRRFRSTAAALILTISQGS